jgi:hypothetical protein
VNLEPSSDAAHPLRQLDHGYFRPDSGFTAVISFGLAALDQDRDGIKFRAVERIGALPPSRYRLIGG